MNRGLPLLVLLFSLFKWFHVWSALLFLPGGDNLILNGSFESGQFVNDPNEPIVGGPNCKMLCGGSSALDNWQVFRLPVQGNQTCDNAKDAICWSKHPGTQDIPPQDGFFDVDLTGFNGRPPGQFGRIQQSIEHTEQGQKYKLSLSVGSSKRFPPPNNSRVFISVNVAASSGASIASEQCNAIQTGEQVHWERCTLDFKAADQLTTIMFTGSQDPISSVTGSDYIGLDNVVMQKVCFIVNAILLGCKL
jgi:hypothetical protein